MLVIYLELFFPLISFISKKNHLMPGLWLNRNWMQFCCGFSVLGIGTLTHFAGLNIFLNISRHVWPKSNDALSSSVFCLFPSVPLKKENITDSQRHHNIKTPKITTLTLYFSHYWT